MKWSESQKRKIILELMKLSSQDQLSYMQGLIKERLPTLEKDFTRFLPRVLTVYIFSFLDPRTLCRCSQVREMDLIAAVSLVDLYTSV